MRIRSGRWIAAIGVLLLARGCYSSIAPTPKIDPGAADTGTPIDPEEVDGCAARKPWEGPGVTGVLPIDGSQALVISGDRYWLAEFDTRLGDASDPTIGKLMAWRESGLLEKLWAGAPRVVGQVPWDDPGVTSVYLAKSAGRRVVISRFRRWVREGDNWIAAGSVVDDWLVNDAGPPEVDGQVPWEGPGVTAAYYTPSGNSFVVISQGKGWLRRTSDPDPKNWTWEAGFNLGATGDAGFVTTPDWPNAPAIGGQRPFEGKGVTTAYYIGSKFFVISADRMWSHDGRVWTGLGLLKDMPGWTSAPSADCRR